MNDESGIMNSSTSFLPKSGEGEGEVDKACNYALFLLGIKLRTEGELREKLKMKKYESVIINKVIHRLKENRYINDQNYAEVYLENLKKYKTFGFYGIKKKLMEKRLPSQIIERVLNEGLGEEEEIKIAKRFLKNRELGIINYEDKQKLAQKLKARGFRSGVVMKLVF